MFRFWVVLKPLSPQISQIYADKKLVILAKARIQFVPNAEGAKFACGGRWRDLGFA